MKTLAAVLVELRRPLALEELEVPRLSYGQVLVRVICSGICGSQLGEIEGVKGPDRYLPHLLGHEGCAEVLEIGPGVKKVQSGQRVVLHWRKGGGLEAEPARYQSARLGAVQSGWVTTFSHHSVVSENRLTPISDDVEPAVAALMGCAVTTGMGVVTRDARLEVGESVLVLGAGGVGLSVLQAARLGGAFPIVATDRFANRLELARQLGADETLLAEETESLEQRRFDVVIETTGLAPLIELSYRLSAPQGKVVLVGVPRAGSQASIHTLPLHFGKSLRGSHGGDTEPDRDIPRYLRLHQSGRLPLGSLVTDFYKLEEINRALDDMRSGAASGRCLVQM